MAEGGRRPVARFADQRLGQHGFRPRELSDGGLIRRYQTTETDDGVKGSEGLFIPCSFWLVDALNAAGQQQDAITLFEQLLRLRNDVGLLSEEWDPGGRAPAGQHPSGVQPLRVGDQRPAAAQRDAGAQRSSDAGSRAR